MKKALLLFDGLNFYENTVSFVQRMHLLSPVLATGLFTPVVSLANVWTYAPMGEPAVPVPALLEPEENTALNENVERFEKLCQASRIPYRVHKETNDLALHALTHESRFADLLVLSGDSFYHEMLFSSPSRYLRDAVHDSECPVLVLPENPGFPKELIIAFDGRRESIYALKQFAYLFPELTGLKTTVVRSVSRSSNTFAEKDLVEELVGAHYKNASYHELPHSDRDGLRNWIESRPDSLVIAGSFSRGWLSEQFRESFCADLIRSHRMPVFIAHH